MSRWESIPSDILNSILPYLDADNPEVIKSLCGDPYINSRLQCDDPNGPLWQYLYTHKLSHVIPTSSTPTLKERYLGYLRDVNFYSQNPKNLLLWAVRMNYETLIENLLKIHPYDQNILDTALMEATADGYRNIVKILVEHGANVSSRESRSYWENVPFSTLVSMLPYIMYTYQDNIDRLCADPILSQRLQCEDPNGFLWEYLYTHKLSRNLPVSLVPSLKDRYYEYQSALSLIPLNLVKWATHKGYEILVHRIENWYVH